MLLLSSEACDFGPKIRGEKVLKRLKFWRSIAEDVTDAGYVGGYAFHDLTNLALLSINFSKFLLAFGTRVIQTAQEHEA